MSYNNSPLNTKNRINFVTNEKPVLEFIKNYPEYDGGFIAEVPWMLERLGEGMGVSLNPDAEEGIDFDPETIRQLLTLHQRNQ